jgi:DNA-binding beta-propeller fold protein YncE
MTAAVAMTILVLGIVFLQQGQRGQLQEASRRAQLRPTGQAQLVAVAPMLLEEGAECQWVPASAPVSLGLLQGGSPAAARPVNANRAPVRTIKDPNPMFSAIAVAPESDMLVVTDENLFQVLEYNRMDNTPPNARMTEPKRIIGGSLTKAEMMCGVYLDPKTLDTYVVNNDTQNWMAVFSKNAQGNVAPDRYLAVPHGTFGIAVDEGRQELYLTVQHDNSIVIYPKNASGEDQPIRWVSGNRTQLEDPHGIALDTRRNLIFVSNHGSSKKRDDAKTRTIYPFVSYEAEREAPSEEGWGFVRGSGSFEPPSITIYGLDASGNAAPLRVIEGPKTGLNWPMQIAVDEERGELYIANDMANSVVVFRATDNGDVAPLRTIKGPKTGIRHPTGVALDLKNKEVWVASMGNHSATVFPLTANGDVAPLRTIRGGPAEEASLMIGNPGAVGYDSKRDQILVPN